MSRYIVGFFIFSFLGWVWETIFCSIYDHKWANRGFLHGPICPIYGFGSVLGFALYDLMRAGRIPDMRWWELFLLGFFVSVALEYPTSIVLEKLFNARWWDYSMFPLNLNGRISVPSSAAFGGAAILMLKVLVPFFDGIMRMAPALLLDALSYVFVTVTAVDATLTISSLTDFQKYVDSIDEGFQNHMTNIVDKIFNGGGTLYNKAIQRIAVFKLPGRKNEIAKQLREKQFVELIKDYYESDVVKQMDEYIQHGTTTTLEHCENVAWISYIINDKLHLNADEKGLVEAAMLHDLYLYDWHDSDPSHKLHGFIHADIAAENAEKHFGISEKEREDICSHMWPLNITKIPKSKEGLIISLADKYCALIETIRLNKRFGLRH